jgi:hypothetical protein
MNTRRLNPIQLSWWPIVPILAGLLAAGCAKSHDHAHHDDDDEHEHSHEPRHGGVAVVLGDEEFHVEFAHGEQPGSLLAYFFDGHMENYVRVATPAFPAIANIGGESRAVTFAAVASAASGETVGDTALFETTVPGFSGQLAIGLTVPELVVKGATFKDITATVPGR